MDLESNNCYFAFLSTQDEDGGLPVIGYRRCNQRICQHSCNKRGDHESCAHVHCYPETPETLRNQPPIKGYEGGLGEIKSHIEEVARYKDCLEVTCLLACTTSEFYAVIPKTDCAINIPSGNPQNQWSCPLLVGDQFQGKGP
jgi:hypothetical protein